MVTLMCLAAILYDISVVLYLVAYSVPFWIQGDDRTTLLHSGLWKTCHKTTFPNGTIDKEYICTDNLKYFIDGQQSNWVYGTQIVFTAALVSLIFITIIINYNTFFENCRKGLDFFFVGICFGFFTVAMLLCGVVVYGIKKATDEEFMFTSLIWGYAFLVVSLVFTFLCTTLLIVDGIGYTNTLADRKRAEKFHRFRPETEQRL